MSSTTTILSTKQGAAGGTASGGMGLGGTDPSLKVMQTMIKGGRKRAGLAGFGMVPISMTAAGQQQQQQPKQRTPSKDGTSNGAKR
jgi:hypothetical protein